MRSKMTPIKAPDNAIDIVGTGGDGTGTRPRRAHARELSEAAATTSVARVLLNLDETLTRE